MVTRYSMLRLLALSLLVTGGFFILPGIAPAIAQEARLVVQGSGLPVPRFVTTKSAKVNMRLGPGREYPVAWVYKKKHFPLKVVAEFDVWRKVEDPDGSTGWIHSPLLTLQRFVLVTEAVAEIRAEPEAEAALTGVAERGVLLELLYCEKGWCRLSHEKARGWVPASHVWGILESEADSVPEADRKAR